MTTVARRTGRGAGIALAAAVVVIVPAGGQAAEDPVMLNPAIGTGQLVTDVQNDPHRITLPRELEGQGQSFWGLYKICVNAKGSVSKVAVVKSAAWMDDESPAARGLDDRWTAVIRTWRYRPYVINGRAVSYCYTLRLQVSGAVRKPRRLVSLVPVNGSGQVLSDTTRPPHEPTLPPQLERPGMQYWGLYKVCVTDTGGVAGVKVVKSADISIDPLWMETIKAWRYQPHAVDGQPTAFCYTLRLQVAVP
jgi:hypothetical protein